MNYKNILIVAVKHENPEVAAGASALKKRYSGRRIRAKQDAAPIDHSSQLVGLSRTLADVYNQGALDSNTEDLGVYVVCHANEGSEVVGSPAFVDRLVRLSSGHRVKRLCLICCYGARNQKDTGAASVLDAPLGLLAMHLLNEGLIPETMVAFDALVYLDADGYKTEIGPSATLVRRNSRERRSKHKFVWTYSLEERGYVCNKKIGPFEPGKVITLRQQSELPLREESIRFDNAFDEEQRVAWQPDDAVGVCPICREEFGVFRWRHHCRRCGRVVCDDCSKHRRDMRWGWAQNPSGNDDLRVRVCNGCVHH